MEFDSEVMNLISLMASVSVIVGFALAKVYYTSHHFIRREARIDYLINQITFTNIKEKKLLQEELDKLKRERENDDGNILESADKKGKLIFELKKEIEKLKGLKSENEKLSGIISEQKKAILDLEMELKIKKSENEKLIY